MEKKRKNTKINKSKSMRMKLERGTRGIAETRGAYITNPKHGRTLMKHGITQEIEKRLKKTQVNEKPAKKKNHENCLLK